MADPASPEGMLLSYHGEDDTGLSAIKEKPVDNRSTWQQLREYLTTGINEDARYALGPHAAPAVKGISSLAAELTPAADTRDALVESQKTAEAVSEGKALEAGIGGLSTLASLAAMFVPGSLSGAKKGTEEVTKQVKRYIDEPVDYTFTTGRGSTYEAFPSGRTQRDKASGHKDGGVGLQRESEKTIFTDGSKQGRKTASNIVGISKSEFPTQILPILSKNSEVVGIKIVHASDYGPKKAGDTIIQMPVSTKPDVGKQPIEIFSRGTDVHLGSPITKIEKGAEEIIPQKIFSKEPDAIGSMTGSTDKYSSVEMIMDKKKFDANVENLPKSQIKKDSVGYLTKALKNNKPVAQPFITLKWDGSTWKPQKGTHEGRHRTIAAEKVFGKGVKFPVNVQLRTKKGSTVPIEELTGRKKFYKVKDQDEADRMLSELEKFNISDVQKKKGGSVIERNPYNYPPRSI